MVCGSWSAARSAVSDAVSIPGPASGDARHEPARTQRERAPPAQRRNPLIHQSRPLRYSHSRAPATGSTPCTRNRTWMMTRTRPVASVPRERFAMAATGSVNKTRFRSPRGLTAGSRQSPLRHASRRRRLQTMAKTFFRATARIRTGSASLLLRAETANLAGDPFAIQTLWRWRRVGVCPQISCRSGIRAGHSRLATSRLGSSTSSASPRHIADRRRWRPRAPLASSRWCGATSKA